MKTLFVISALLALSILVSARPNPDLKSTIREVVRDSIKEIVRDKVREALKSKDIVQGNVREALENAIDKSLDDEEEDDMLVDNEDEYTKDDPAEEMNADNDQDKTLDQTDITTIPDYYLDEMKEEKLSAVKADKTTQTGPMPEQDSNMEALLDSAEDVAKETPSTAGQDGPSEITTTSKKGSDDDLKELEDTIEAIDGAMVAPLNVDTSSDNKNDAVEAPDKTAAADDAAMDSTTKEDAAAMSMDGEIDVVEENDKEEKQSEMEENERLTNEIVELESELKQALGKSGDKLRKKAIAVKKFCTDHPNLAVRAFDVAGIFDGMFGDRGKDTPDEDIAALPNPKKDEDWLKSNPNAKKVKHAVEKFCGENQAICIAECEDVLGKVKEKFENKKMVVD